MRPFGHANARWSNAAAQSASAAADLVRRIDVGLGLAEIPLPDILVRFACSEQQSKHKCEQPFVYVSDSVLTSTSDDWT